MGPLIPTFSRISTTIVSEQENGQRSPTFMASFFYGTNPTSASLASRNTLSLLSSYQPLLLLPTLIRPMNSPNTPTLHLIFRSPLNQLKPATNPNHTKNQTAYAPLSCIS